MAKHLKCYVITTAPVTKDWETVFYHLLEDGIGFDDLCHLYDANVNGKAMIASFDPKVSNICNGLNR